MLAEILLCGVIIILTAGLGVNLSAPAAVIYCLQELRERQLNSSMAAEDLIPMDFNDESVVSNIMAAFQWGMPCLLWIIGILTQIISVNSIFAIPHIWGGIGAMLTPALFRLSFGSIMSLRVIEGLLAGWNAPMLVAVAHYNFDEKWFGLTSGLFFAAWFAGIIASYPIEATFCNEKQWSAIFYIAGLTVLIATVLYLLLTCSCKEKKEKNLKFVSIREVLRQFAQTTRAVLKHRNIYLLAICQFLTFLFLNVFFMFIPKYLHDVHHITLDHSSWLTTMPTLAGIVSRLLSGPLADLCVARLGVTVAMRLLHVIACATPAALTAFLAFSPHLTSGVAVTILVVTCFIFCIYTTSVLMPLGYLYTDLCAFVSGLVGTFAAFGYLVTPYLVEWITRSQTAKSWSMCFVIVGVIPLILALVIYMFIDFNYILSSEKLKPLSISYPSKYVPQLTQEEHFWATVGFLSKCATQQVAPDANTPSTSKIGQIDVY